MNRRLFVAAIAVVIVLSGFIVAADPPAAYSPVAVSPGHNSLLTTSTPLFTWTGFNTHRYIIKITHIASGQSIKLVRPGSACVTATTCTLQFNPTEVGWKWKKSDLYTWIVIWKDGKQMLGKSQPTTFQTDLLYASANVAPSNNSNSHDTGFGITFQWSRHPATDDYRVVLIRPDGTKRKTAWLNNLQCSSSCSTTIDFPGERKGITYQWFVQGRSDGVQGKVNSSKTSFTRK